MQQQQQPPFTIYRQEAALVMEEAQVQGPSSSSSSSSRVVKALPDARHGAASMLVAKVVDLMTMHLNAGILLNNSSLLVDLFCSLAKGIDHAVANNEVPRRCRDLPPLLKQVYGSPDNLSIQEDVMMLTMCIQCACKLEWFSDQDSNDLLKLAKEVMKSFSNPDCILREPTHTTSRLSEVMSRFYPNMTVERLLFSLELKDLQPGYRCCAADFPISRGTISSKQEKVHLIVAQKDNVKTSACIITPAEVTFILNGQEVEGRTSVSMDKGPQLPTDVTKKLKFGVNCLQAIGQFKGNYLVIIAVMTTTQSPNPLKLQDFVEPIASTNSETQTMQMASRISLNCPISKSRIKTPVKGELCRHFQCFDYDNFLEINSKRPSWECPYCKQPVCYVDIRIDQNFAKVLSEAGEEVVDVIMSANGSWSEDKDHPAQMSGDSQVGHQNDESRSTTDGSTSLQNYNETVSAAATSVPTQKLPFNVLCSAFNSKQHLFSSFTSAIHGSLRAQSSGADISSTSLVGRRIRNDELQSLDEADGASVDWRPTNRMRGSLTGEAYSAALRQFGIQPTPSVQAPPVQASRPPSSAVSFRGPLTNAVADRSASQTEESSKPS